MIRQALSILVVLVLLAPLDAVAQLQAHFEAEQLDYNGSLSDCDFSLSGLPECELYFRMGVYYNNSPIGELLNHPGGCSYFGVDDGFWNFPDQTVSRQLPDMSNSAQIYFALYDEDPLDDDDLLGTHFKLFTGPDSAADINNQVLSVLQACDGGTVDNNGGVGRFQLYYQVWFTDDTGPSPPPMAPTHFDADSTSGYDNDTLLAFDWDPGSDPHSGITGYDYQLREDGVLTDSGFVSSSEFTFNGSGAINGHEYDISVRAQNGAALPLNNSQYSEWTEWSAVVLVDLVVDEILSISAFTEPGGVAIGEGEAQSDNTPYLEWTVAESISPIKGYSFATGRGPSCIVNTSGNSTTIGPLAPGSTTFYVRAIDEAGNCGPTASFEIVYVIPPLEYMDGFEDLPEGDR